MGNDGQREKALERLKGEIQKQYMKGYEDAIKAVAKGKIDLSTIERIITAPEEVEVLRATIDVKGKTETYCSGYVAALRELFQEAVSQ
jgi:hypothetical protein